MPETLRNDENVAEVCTAVMSDQCMVTEDIANEIHISNRSVQSILKHNCCAKFVPCILTKDQIGIRKVISAELFE
jgi:hypothetical protein